MLTRRLLAALALAASLTALTAAPSGATYCDPLWEQMGKCTTSTTTTSTSTTSTTTTEVPETTTTTTSTVPDTTSTSTTTTTTEAPTSTTSTTTLPEPQLGSGVSIVHPDVLAEAATPPAELAHTGNTSYYLALIAFGLLAAGLGILTIRRR